jgi:hypothetical protein
MRIGMVRRSRLPASYVWRTAQFRVSFDAKADIIVILPDKCAQFAGQVHKFVD